ncbi:hypothetical protein DES53_102706 [Roseimicrobium gellanilyticum]|uniref:DksA C4-type domain-containing protein n=1 Tax=Roseimicrobium gellanilyticum TaxID=748857 RepID=A0A366HT91_9BACT|nr:hypothetical protein [Roseimicrobium gellanilyticum]RBP46318.1 hypothetical protein DES53_102706 [Roseimicrobium gellanilyticum]
MTQEDQTLLQEYMRVRTTPNRIFVEVKMVDGGDGDTLATRWSLACVLPSKATPLQVDRARMIALADYRYFRTCDSCREKLPAGLVPSGENGVDVCQNCR